MDDSFGIDLDKVLDDFEKSQDPSTHSDPSHSGPYWLPSPRPSGVPPSKNSSFYASSNSSYVSLLNESAEKINLADADFSASSASLTNSVQPVAQDDDPVKYGKYIPSTLNNSVPPVVQDEETLLYNSFVPSLLNNSVPPVVPDDNPSLYNSFVPSLLTNSVSTVVKDDEPSVYSKYVPLQDKKWLGDPVISNGFDHEEEEVLAVEVMTAVDRPTNFEIKLLPSDTTPEEAFCGLNLESVVESESQLPERENVQLTNRELPNGAPCLMLPEESPTSSDESFTEEEVDAKDVAAGPIPIEEPSVYDLEPDLGFDENEVSDSSDEEKLDLRESTVAVGFDNSVVDDVDCDDMENYLSDFKTLDGLVENVDGQSGTCSTKNDVAGFQSSDSSRFMMPAMVCSVVNTGARPKVRDVVKDSVKEEIPREPPPEEEAPKEQSSVDEGEPETLGSVLVKTVVRVHEQAIDFNDVSHQSLHGLKQDQTDSLDSESSGGKKARPTSLNLPGRLSVDPPTSLVSPEEGVVLMPLEVEERLVEIENTDDQPGLHEGSLLTEDAVLEDVPELSEEEQLVGKLQPFWIPDVDAPNCMHCDLRFTVLKRRHHCRACGKVLCSQCCNRRAKLPYLDYKEVRVCHPCLTVLNKVAAVEHLYNPGGSPTAPQAEEVAADDSPSQGALVANTPSPVSPAHQPEDFPGWSPNPNNPPEYCSKVPPLEQALSERPPPTVMVPIGVLKRGDKTPAGRREQKQVMFSDGIRPGGDLTDLDAAPEPRLPYRRPARLQRRMDKGSPVPSPTEATSPTTGSGRRLKLMRARGRVLVHDEAGPLPPLVSNLDFNLEDKPDPVKLLQRLQEETSAPVVFALTKNLSVSVKIIQLDCCMGQEVWCFSSSGMSSVGQDEVLFLLQRLPDEKAIPRDVFVLLTAIYDNATRGTWFTELGHLLFPEGLLGAREHAGVLFVRPSHQCQSRLPLPQPPHLVALLIQKWEVPWAKVFPLRLLLRIGAEFRYYPCPLVSVRFRKPVYGEIGHTIMDVLADFRNYQYTLPVVPGVTVTMEDKKTTVNFPRNRYDHILKFLNSSNEHVLGLGASFCVKADSHLVCMQNEDGSYQTQAINIQNTPHKVTGASFIVFSGALKSSSGLSGKSSIVEDGLLVQISQDSMGALKTSIRDMKDYLISCGQVDAPSTQEQVLLKWTQDDRAFNIGVKSAIDGRSLEGVESIRIQTGTDYATSKFLVRWTEVFFLTSELNSGGRRLDPADPCKISEAISQACCLALTPHLDSLMDAGLTRIGLRVTMDAENVGYEIGSCGRPLEGSHLVDLDSSLIPIIMGSADTPLVVELIFHVLHK